nr:putative ribonuclease H-like domain-containing protein [Tanacetum cinerariifolium]
MAFISSAKHSRGNKEVNTASVSTASTNVPTASANIRVASISQDTACTYIASQSSGSQIKFKDINQIDEDDIEEMDIKWNMALLSMRADKFWKKTGKKISIQGTDVAGFEKSKALKALMAIDGVGWDWSYMANDEENHALVANKESPTEFALMANTSVKSKVFDNSLCFKDCKKNTDSLNSKITDLSDKLFDAKNMIYHYKLGLAQVESRLVEHKDREIKYCEKIKGLELEVEFKTNGHECLTKELETLKKEKEGLDGKLAGFQTALKDLDSLFESQRLDKNKEGLGYSVVPPPPAQIYSSPKKDMSWTGLPEFKDDIVTDYSRPVPTVESSPDDAQNKNPFVTKTEASSSTISPKSFIKFVKAKDSPTNIKTDKAEIAKKPPVKKFPTGGTKFSTADMGKKGKAVKPSACWFWNPSQNLSNKGYVSFGQGGCKITCKGTIKTGKLKFENVYFVKDLKYNLFSVSQICDNKNSALFTDSECIMLGRNFKLLDNDNVLLRTPRQHNMYSIDLNNIVPHKDLTCLVAKASADECMLWHRRLGHLNFKTMNKLVRHNLVRGLPTKCFENDHTCTACLKGKQHKASCKSKLVNSVSKPLHTLHMDLFGPTFVSSISHKWYCLVVIDDFSRFTWTFFLKTKDETCGILRKFITEIKKLKDLKVKIISTDVPESSGISNPTATSTNPPPDQLETLTVETLIPTVSSPVPTAYLNNSLKPSTSPTPTLRIHKDHPKSQIIGPVDTLIQTKNKSKEVEEQSFIAIIHQKTDPALLQFCLFSCFLSQVEPKKIFDALQDPSWVGAIQKELL